MHTLERIFVHLAYNGLISSDFSDLIDDKTIYCISYRKDVRARNIQSIEQSHAQR